MKRQQIRLGAACLCALTLTGTILAVHGCSTDPEQGTETQAAVGSGVGDGSSTPISQLPFIDATTNAQLLAELLDKPTALGETTALQVRLPPPRNTAIASSLVRVIGDTSNPHVLFQSDALAQMHVIARSPGKDFFTAFVTLLPQDLDVVKRNQDQIATGVFGQTTNESVLFSGRTAIGRTINPALDPSVFRAGGIPTPVGRCPLVPVSTTQAWGQALFITSPSVVLNAARTWDPCTGAGTQGGVWTFAHLIREMANGSGQTPENFVKDWLSLWLNSYTVNGDVVPARTQMFNQVIQPWATASGVTATLVTDPITGVKSVSLSGPLNLNIAPYRLEAIVNRIDLGTTTTGGSTYGSMTGSPVTAGELRFIFGVVQPNPWGGGSEATCGRKLFTTIFEYGVPGIGCSAVVSWAQKWTTLLGFPGFTAAYLAQLQSMTESVVVHGAAPAKGNQNAINQIRTNEIALSAPWELREFTLTNEQPAANIDPPISGELRKHTVAQTPDDATHSAAGADPGVNAVVLGPVTAGLELPVVLTSHCESSYTVPFLVSGTPFRGGNALVGPPTGVNLWKANSAPATPNGICARHQFSLNTCNGCHHNDTGTNGLGGSTNFTHIDPLSSIPVTLSKFLTGGGPGLTFNVQDTQFAAPVGPLWPFADLDRRLKKLVNLSHCTPCITTFPLTAALVDRMAAFGPIPADINPADRPDLKIGPITDLATVQKVIDLRSSVAGGSRQEPIDFIRAVDRSSH